MANVSMNLGDKLIFDANDATNPSTTYLTNPSAATNPNNTIEVWCNGTKRAEFQNTKFILGTDIEFTTTAPSITCAHSLTVALGSSLPAEFKVTAGGAGDILSVSPAGGIVVTGAQISMDTADSTTRVINSGSADIELASSYHVNLRANAKNNQSNSKVRIYDFTTLVASMESAGIALNVNTSVSGTLSVSGAASAGSLVAGSATLGDATFTSDATFLGSGNFTGKVDGFLGGVRTKVQSGTPTGGASGDMIVYSSGTTYKLYINFGGTWRSVALA